MPTTMISAAVRATPFSHGSVCAERDGSALTGGGFSAAAGASLGSFEGKTNSWAHCRHLPFLPRSFSVILTRHEHLGQLKRAMSNNNTTMVFLGEPR